MKSTLIIVGVVLVMAAIIAGAIWKFRAIAQAEAEADATVMTPYLELLQQGKAEEAWEKYTTPAFKARFSREAYARAISALGQEQGSLKSWRRTLCNEISEPGRGTYLRMKYIVTWDKGDRVTTWDVLKLDGGGFAIDASYNVPAGGGLEPAPR